MNRWLLQVQPFVRRYHGMFCEWTMDTQGGLQAYACLKVPHALPLCLMPTPAELAA